MYWHNPMEEIFFFAPIDGSLLGLIAFIASLFSREGEQGIKSKAG